jgi:hypothetical protein
MDDALTEVLKRVFEIVREHGMLYPLYFIVGAANGEEEALAFLGPGQMPVGVGSGESLLDRIGANDLPLFPLTIYIVEREPDPDKQKPGQRMLHVEIKAEKRPAGRVDLEARVTPRIRTK